MNNKEKSIDLVWEFYSLFSIDLENTLHISECIALAKLTAFKIKSEITDRTHFSKYYFWDSVHTYLKNIDSYDIEKYFSTEKIKEFHKTKSN